VPLVAYGFLLFSVGFNLIGLRIGSRIQSSVLLLLIIVLSLVIVFALPHSKVENITPFMPNGLASIGAAVAVCFYSFLGWENVSSVAEDVKDPSRTFRRAIPWAIVCVGVLYTGIAWVYLAVVPGSQRADDPTVLDPILRVAFGRTVAEAGSALAILLLILTTNSWVLGASRLLFAASRDGLLPTRLATLSAASGAPTYALLLLAAGYSLVILLITSIGEAEALLIKLSNASFMLVYLLAFVASLRVFTDPRLKACSWISLAFAAGFSIFFGWSMMIAVALLLVFYPLVQARTQPLSNLP
jgi:amino acid efflux transporter